MKEIKEIQEEIQTIRKDRKAVEILGNWYQSQFKIIPEDINKGDIVNIKYKINKGFNNIISMDKLGTENTEIKPVIQDTKKEQISSTLTSYCKDIYIASIQFRQSQDLILNLDTISDQVIKTYNKIKQSI